ncbi:MAG: putative transcriptional regulator [Kiritimatiellia bacterium]
MRPCLLIASPQMKDPFFERSVVLIWHHDEDGAIGIVLNRPLSHNLSDVLAASENTPIEQHPGATVSWGGPVERGTGTVVARADLPEELGWSVATGVCVTRSEQALNSLLEQRTELILCLGYAGWGAGQLDAEISSGGWLYTEASQELIFDAPREALYDAALASLGLTRSTVIMKPIEA